jgi:hypothetical protein
MLVMKHDEALGVLAQRRKYHMKSQINSLLARVKPFAIALLDEQASQELSEIGSSIE